MRVFAVSDIHVDYELNARWVSGLSSSDFRDDVLILAGDVSDTLERLEWCLRTLAVRFRQVLFVPGNHDLWVLRERQKRTSLQKFEDVVGAVAASGASMRAFRQDGVHIVPLLGWYDYSFGEPSDALRSMWMDFHACRWPDGYDAREIAQYFAARNEVHAVRAGEKVITFSHFLPRIDVMPGYIPEDKRLLYPVLGSTGLERELRRLSPSLHVYGHSHVNRSVTLEGLTYVNNALGYPQEAQITSRQLLRVH